VLEIVFSLSPKQFPPTPTPPPEEISLENVARLQRQAVSLSYSERGASNLRTYTLDTKQQAERERRDAQQV